MVVPAIPLSSAMSHRSLPSPDLLERLVPGRIHVLVGGPGTGKTTLCLRFVAAGLAAGERAALLFMMRGADVMAHARRIAIDLDAALRSERLILLRYRPDFGERCARTASPARAIEELERLFASVRPARIAIDSFAPMLGEEAGGGHAMAALAAWLDRSGATSLLTYPEDVSRGYDRRLEPVMQNAAAIFRLERSRDRVDIETLVSRVTGLTRVGDAVPDKPVRDADHTILALRP
jgi:KaiC/GvpD/RAD55 family RecA-like ATPase